MGLQFADVMLFETEEGGVDTFLARFGHDAGEMVDTNIRFCHG
nr:hypothetical protein [Tateyamaria sp. syn59]